MQTTRRKTLHHLQEVNKVFKKLSTYCKIYLLQIKFKINILTRIQLHLPTEVLPLSCSFVLAQWWGCDTPGEPRVVLATGWAGSCFPCSPEPYFTSASGELMAMASLCLSTFLSKNERENYFLRVLAMGKQKRIKSQKLSLFVQQETFCLQPKMFFLELLEAKLLCFLLKKLNLKIKF